MEELDKTEARQGVNRGVRYVLIISLALAVIGLLASGIFAT